MVGIWDLDEATRTRLLKGNPELAAELGGGGGRGKQEAPPVDPEVQAALDKAAALKEETLDLRAQAQFVAAEARLLTAQTGLRVASMRARQAGSGRGHHGQPARRSLLRTALLLFPACYVVVALLGG